MDGTHPCHQLVSKNNLPLLPLNPALAGGGRTFAAAKAKVQSRPGFAADAASGPGSKQTVNQFRRRLNRKKKQMKKLQTNEPCTAAGQPFKTTTPTPKAFGAIGIHQERRIPMNRHTRRILLSLAAVVLAGLAMAAPRPAIAQYVFTTLDFPGAAGTEILGFSTRTMVGDFVDAAGNNHGWLLPVQSGNFLQYDVPGAWFTSLSAINHLGQFGGVFRDDPAHPARRHGFIVVNGVLTTIDYPGSTRTSIVQMNDLGQAVGIGRIPSEGPTTPHGFIWQGGVFNEVSFPGAFGTGLDGINEQGDVSGFTTDEAGGLTHAMMRVNGVFSHIEPPGAIDSIALSINDRGQVAGWYDDAQGNTHGFIYYEGVFATIDPPGALASEITSIDNAGIIVGDYIGADGVDHGFIGTPKH
jgi:probable HAF family extracellular repeat protein